MTVAALFVEKGGVYYEPGLDVDPWDEERDARKYAGPHRVVAHPDCARWGRYANGGPGFRGDVRPVPGDDGACFAFALYALERWGGVLEHPAGSLAWGWYGLTAPKASGGWSRARRGSELFTCKVEQGNYGHRARKATWLLVSGTYLPELNWSMAPQQLIRERDGDRSTRTGICQNLSGKQRRATPIPFRDLLLSIADPTRNHVRETR